MKKLFKQVIILTIFLSFGLSSITTQALTREEYEKTGDILWEVKTKDKMVAITFDDGPHPVHTPEILDLLAKYNAKATFFVLGKKAELHPEIIKREIKEGHEIGNHTYSHLYATNASSEKLSSELKKTDKIIENTIGYPTYLYRPVGGQYDSRIIKMAAQNKKLVIMWSWHQDPKDWSRKSAYQISKHVTSALMPGDIILLHDWSGRKNSQTVKALETILKHIDKNGYRCVTVSELIYRSSKPIPMYIHPNSN